MQSGDFLLRETRKNSGFETEISQEKTRKKAATSTKVPHVEVGFLSVTDVAKKLGKSAMTITRWCEMGKLPAIPRAYGQKTTYLISPSAIEIFLSQKQAAQEKQHRPHKCHVKVHQDYIKPWHQAMAKGLLNGKAFSPHTINSYSYYVNEFFKKHKAVTVESLKVALSAISVDSVAVKEKTYKAVVCFSKYLIMEGVLDSDFPHQVKPLAPKYHKPPKRNTVQPEQLASLLSVCETPFEWCILQLLVGTGLRASELCALTRADIDLKKAVLTVQCGKGGKQRDVGLGKSAIDALNLYLAKHPKTTPQAYLFLNSHGQPLNRSNLYQQLQQLGNRAGVTVSPHALRRAFVTINANKGRPLQMLQIACGHSKITTTMSYCRTSEQEVIDAMKDWG